MLATDEFRNYRSSCNGCRTNDCHLATAKGFKTVKVTSFPFNALHKGRLFFGNELRKVRLGIGRNFCSIRFGDKQIFTCFGTICQRYILNFNALYTLRIDVRRMQLGTILGCFAKVDGLNFLSIDALQRIVLCLLGNQLGTVFFALKSRLDTVREFLARFASFLGYFFSFACNFFCSLGYFLCSFLGGIRGFFGCLLYGLCSLFYSLDRLLCGLCYFFYRLCSFLCSLLGCFNWLLCRLGYFLCSFRNRFRVQRFFDALLLEMLRSEVTYASPCCRAKNYATCTYAFFLWRCNGGFNCCIRCCFGLFAHGRLLRMTL